MPVSEGEQSGCYTAPARFDSNAGGAIAALDAAFRNPERSGACA